MAAKPTFLAHFTERNNYVADTWYGGVTPNSAQGAGKLDALWDCVCQAIWRKLKVDYTTLAIDIEIIWEGVEDSDRAATQQLLGISMKEIKQQNRLRLCITDLDEVISWSLTNDEA
jgi:RNAse (barnase) inhibitor barstar